MNQWLKAGLIVIGIGTIAAIVLPTLTVLLSVHEFFAVFQNFH